MLKESAFAMAFFPREMSVIGTLMMGFAHEMIALIERTCASVRFARLLNSFASTLAVFIHDSFPATALDLDSISWLLSLSETIGLLHLLSISFS